MPLLLLFAAVFYGLFMVFISRASGKADDFFLNFVVNMIGALLPFAIFIILKARGTTGSNTKEGLIFGSLAGVAIAIYSVLLVKAFAKGGNLAYVTPTVYGGAIIISSLIGWFVLRQTAQPLQIAGVIVVAVGIGLIVASKL